MSNIPAMVGSLAFAFSSIIEFTLKSPITYKNIDKNFENILSASASGFPKVFPILRNIFYSYFYGSNGFFSDPEEVNVPAATQPS